MNDGTLSDLQPGDVIREIDGVAIRDRVVVARALGPIYGDAGHVGVVVDRHGSAFQWVLYPAQAKTVRYDRPDQEGPAA